jgi:hypothetical protein
VGRDRVEEHAELRRVPDLVDLDDGVGLRALGALGRVGGEDLVGADRVNEGLAQHGVHVADCP